MSNSKLTFIDLGDGSSNLGPMHVITGLNNEAENTAVPNGPSIFGAWVPGYQPNMHSQSAGFGFNGAQFAAQSSHTPPFVLVNNMESTYAVGGSSSNIHQVHGEMMPPMNVYPTDQYGNVYMGYGGLMNQGHAYNCPQPFSFQPVIVPPNPPPPPPPPIPVPVPGQYFLSPGGFGPYVPNHAPYTDPFNPVTYVQNHAPYTDPLIPVTFVQNHAPYTEPFSHAIIQTHGAYIDAVNHVNHAPDPAMLPTGAVPKGPVRSMPVEEMLKKYQEFKRFDMVKDFSDHHFASTLSMMQPSKQWTKKIMDEWRVLEKNLPDDIYVRVYESRMDLLRAVIVGAEGTPYHDGLFFFDVFFPAKYPAVPPAVHYQSKGLRLNPNLYGNGKVCLSLLNTWNGDGNEMWNPRVSTMLQVLVSIQALVLNAKPYFNEPGYAEAEGTPLGENTSSIYNKDVFILSMKTILYTLRQPTKNFEDLIFGHFYNRAEDIIAACQAYINGVHGTYNKNQSSNDNNQH